MKYHLSLIKISDRWLLSIVILLVSVKLAVAQTPTVFWQSCYGGSNRDYGYHIAQTKDSGFIAIGSTYSSDSQVTGYHGNEDIWVIRLSATGNLLWEKCFGGANIDQGSWIQQTFDGNYILIGTTQSTDGNITNYFGSGDIWVVKLNDTGAIIWQHNYGAILNDVGKCIQQTADSGYIFCGYTYNGTYPSDTVGEVTGNHGGIDAWVVKIDDTGGIIWQKCYGGSNEDGATTIQQTTDGGYIVGATTSSSDGNITSTFGGGDYWILKLNDTGKIVWQKTYGGSAEDDLTSVSQTFNGGYVATGTTYSNNGEVTGFLGSTDIWTLKLNDTGGIIWEKCYGGSSGDLGASAQQTSDSGFIMVGSTYSSDDEVTGYMGDEDIWAVKTDQSGNLQWQKTLGGDSLDNGSWATQIFNGQYVVIGWTRSTDSSFKTLYIGGGADYYIAEFGGSFIATSVNSLNTNDDNIKLYPIPTSDILNIEMPEDYEQAELQLFDFLGQRISLQSKYGSYRILNLGDLPAGIYFLRISNKNKTLNFKIIHS